MINIHHSARFSKKEEKIIITITIGNEFEHRIYVSSHVLENTPIGRDLMQQWDVEDLYDRDELLKIKKWDATRMMSWFIQEKYLLSHSTERSYVYKPDDDHALRYKGKGFTGFHEYFPLLYSYILSDNKAKKLMIASNKVFQDFKFSRWGSVQMEMSDGKYWISNEPIIGDNISFGEIINKEFSYDKPNGHIIKLWAKDD